MGSFYNVPGLKTDFVLIDMVTPTLQKVIGGVNKVKPKLMDLNVAFRQVGLAAGIAGAAMVGFVKKTVDSFGTYDQAIAEATAATQFTADEYVRMRDLVEKATVELNLPLKELTEIFRQLGYSGKTAAEQLDAFWPIAQMVKIAQLDASEATKDVVQALNGFNKPLSDTNNLVSQLTKAFTMAQHELTDISEALAYSSSQSEITNMSFAELSATLAIMADVGLKGSRAGVVMRRALSNMSDPTSKATRALEKMGIETYKIVDGVHKFKSFPAILAEMEDYFRRYDVAVQEVYKSRADVYSALTENAKDFNKAEDERIRNWAIAAVSGIRAQTGVLAITRKGTAAFREYVKEIENAGNILDHMASKIMKAFNNQVGKMKRSLELVGIYFAQTLIPTLNDYVGRITVVSEVIRIFIKNNKEFTASVAKTTLAVGLLLSALGSLSISIWLLKPALTGIAAIFTTIFVTQLPLTLAVTALGVAFYALYANIREYWPEITRIWEKGVDSVRRFCEKAKNEITLMWDYFKEGAKVISTFIIDQVTKAIDTVIGRVVGLTRAMRSAFKYMVSWPKLLTHTPEEMIEDVITAYQEGLNLLKSINGLKNLAVTLPNL